MPDTDTDLEPTTKCVHCEEPMHESEVDERGLCEACDH